MPQRKERAGRYIRESDERLVAGTTTMESQTKVVNEYCDSQRYICEPEHEWREAISAVEVPYMERKELLKMLAAAKRREFDVLVISEVRALARRQVEVLVIYDMLQKYGVRLETVKEKFGEDAMSKAILSLRSMFVEIEVEQSKMRMMRGRADRILIGKAPNIHPKAAFGYVLVNTETEIKGAYQLNDTIVFVDDEGLAWTEYKIVAFIFELFKQGNSLHGICRVLNERKLPTPKSKQYWLRGSVHFILTNRIYCGEVWANRYGKEKTANGKRSNVVLPKENWVRLPDAPALISVEEFEAIQRQLKINKEESIRNYKGSREELGLLRCGYIFCGVCGRRMRSIPASPAGKKMGNVAYYVCADPERDSQPGTRHTTRISLPKLDEEVRTLIVEILKDPLWCRERVRELREEQKKDEPVITKEDIQVTVDKLKGAIRRLYKLAEHAIDDETVEELAEQMNGLERQKRQAEMLLLDLDETDEQEQELEKEIQRFECWADEVRPLLTDLAYVPGYSELRLAIRVLGIRCIVFPTGPNYPFRHKIDVTIPKIMGVLFSDKTNPYLCPEVLMDFTRGTRKSHARSGCRKGATKPPLAPST
jgi:site-specific DNA recombinase